LEDLRVAGSLVVDGQDALHQNGSVIVELVPSHLDGCLAVISSLPDWFGYPAALDDIAAAVRSQAGFVALEDGEVVGFVTLRPYSDESLEITYLAVRADRRRGGRGRSLLHAVKGFAHSGEFAVVSLLTLGPESGSSHYAETVEFYVASGFWRVKEIHIAEWRGAPSLVMVALVDQLP
jgi:GNAT superfamily N-acetyltransferase